MNPLRHRKILISALVILTVSFTACARKPAPPPPFSVLRITTPLTHARQKALAATLQSRDVQMIQQGSRTAYPTYKLLFRGTNDNC